mmetsp:Transcript_18090/g.62471  ORF Transcript_18090/g.62471 Transcript_18090/m.62471 type:complete len:211 (+) Transcript_18090:107-739(+)
MEALGLPEMVDAPQPMSAAEFVKLDHAGFRTWLKANNLGDFESTLPASSDLKPSDLLSNLFETGALNLKAILDDEVGAGVNIKLSTVARIQDGVASAANLKRAAGATSRSGSGSAKACVPRRVLWGPMVAAANLLDVKASRSPRRPRLPCRRGSPVSRRIECSNCCSSDSEHVERQQATCEPPRRTRGALLPSRRSSMHPDGAAITRRLA